MSKAPAFQFYPADWQRDMTEHPLEIEGAWIRICCALWWSDTPGKATKPLTNWARILRVGEKKSLSIIEYLDNQNIAEVVNQNGTISITCRRMVHDEHIRNIRRLSGYKGGNPALTGRPAKTDLDKQSEDNLKSTPSSSSSSSSSNLYKTIVEYLNQKTGKSYKHTTKALHRHLSARLNEGHTLEDFKYVIDTKCADWLRDERMVIYLRPETLFGTKFESYLNERPRPKTSTATQDDLEAQIEARKRSLEEKLD